MKSGQAHIIGIGREVVVQRRDGSTLPVYLSVSQIDVAEAHGESTRTLFTGIMRDLTEQKEMETALIHSRRAAEAANRSKSEFLANMSHEIRTPMTAILGFSEVVLGSVTDPQVIDSLQTIQRNGQYLIEIINDILDISKIESGKLEVESIPCSPHDIMSGVAELMQVRTDAKGLALDLKYDSPLPETIQSDPTRLRQILINLAGNAIKFTESGSVCSTSRVVDRTSAEPKIQFDVTDTGIGISQEGLSKLFKPFAQADTSTTRKFGGTGLGLTINRRLAEMLGGDVSVTSVVGQGSTFTVTINAGSLTGVKLIQDPTRADVKDGSRKKAESANVKLDCRVLLAEDGPDNQRLIAFLLKKAGAKVTVAENGQVAYDLALQARCEGNPFHVILMDMQMPVLDGYDATTQLREAGYTGAIVALTAHAMSSDREKCLNAGCDDYATKPVDRKQLIAKVAEHASRALQPAAF